MCPGSAIRIGQENTKVEGRFSSRDSFRALTAREVFAGFFQTAKLAGKTPLPGRSSNTPTLVRGESHDGRRGYECGVTLRSSGLCRTVSELLWLSPSYCFFGKVVRNRRAFRPGIRAPKVRQRWHDPRECWKADNADSDGTRRLERCGCNCGCTLLNAANVSSICNGSSVRARLVVSCC